MAKIEGLGITTLHNSAGKLTMRRTVYGNIVSQKISKTTNRKSLAQAMQRCKIASVLKAYQLTKEITDHSFEGISFGVKSMNEFKRLNMSLIKTVKDDDVYFNEMKSRVIFPYYSIIARGSLINNLKIQANSARAFSESAPTLFDLSAFTNISTLKPVNAINWGLQAGDQLTFVGQQYNMVSLGESGHLETKLVLARIVFNDKLVADSTLTLFTGDQDKGYQFNPELIDTKKSENVAAIHPNEGTITLGNIPLFNLQTIISRKTSTGWLRSNAAFETQTAVEAVMEDTDNTFSGYKTYADSSLYLNNATA